MMQGGKLGILHRHNSCLPVATLADLPWLLRTEKKDPILQWAKTCLCALLLILSNGCSQIPSGEVAASSRQSFILYHIKQAQKHIDSGHYHQALTHISILRLTDPDNKLYDDNFEDVNNLASHKKAKLLEQSKMALQRGNTEKSRRLILKSLTITPDDSTLIAELRDWSTHQLRQEQTRKQAKYAVVKEKKPTATTESAQEQAAKVTYNTYAKRPADPLAPYRRLFKKKQYQALIDAVAKSNPVEVPIELESWLMQSHLVLALDLQKQKRFESSLVHAEQAVAYKSANNLTKQVKNMQKELSQLFLEKSKGLIRNDIDKAIHLLELASEYDESNSLISTELAKVQRIKTNLNKIKAQN